MLFICTVPHSNSKLKVQGVGLLAQRRSRPYRNVVWMFVVPSAREIIPPNPVDFSLHQKLPLHPIVG